MSITAARSASDRAAPAPCRAQRAYGRGGTEPTVTDANLVLGRLDKNDFLGGEHEARRRAPRTA